MSYQPRFIITPELLARVEAIAALRERIMSAVVQVPWIPALQKDTRARNTHSSTAIEGNPLTLEQVRAVEEGKELVAVNSRARQEVSNYFAAPKNNSLTKTCSGCTRSLPAKSWIRAKQDDTGRCACASVLTCRRHRRMSRV